jgi:hypothetical protein
MQGGDQSGTTRPARGAGDAHVAHLSERVSQLAEQQICLPRRPGSQGRSGQAVARP